MKNKILECLSKKITRGVKSQLGLAVLLILLNVTNGWAQVPSYVPTNGLVGWWPFNGNANDESGNGNNGTVNGATLTADRNGNANAAYSFDGVNDFIMVSNSSSLNSNFISISAWFVSIDTSYSCLFYKTDASAINEQYACSINYPSVNNNLWYVKTGNNCSNPGVGWNQLDIDSNISDSIWHNIVCTFNGVKSELYLDGNLVGTSSFLPGTIDNCGGELNFGKGYNLNYPLKGNLDDIGIWNRALTQQEITNLYTASTPPPCNPLAANLMNGLVGYWPFCGNANDESGNGNNGTVNGATLTSDRFGNVDAAYSFDGNGDYIRISHSNELRLSGNFSISAWVSPSNLNTFNSILSKASNDQTFVSGWVWGYSNFSQPAQLHFQGSPLFTNVSISNLGNSLSLNSWKNVIVTYDSTASILKYYLDNIQIDSFLISYDFTNSLLDLFIGNHFQNNDPSLQVQTNGGFWGQIDDIGIWNRALTQNEITQLYTGSPCVNYQVITVTDTLIINANLTGVNPVTFQNSIKVYPNPSSTQITIDFGSNYSTMASYTMRIQNAVGQTVYTTGVTQQQFTSNLSTWTGNGIYFVYLIDAQGNTVDVKKIILQ
jgi:hypothetical protein